MSRYQQWLIEQEMERVEKIIASYPPEEQEQIWAGTWKSPAKRQKGEPAQGEGPESAISGQ